MSVYVSATDSEMERSGIELTRRNAWGVSATDSEKERSGIELTRRNARGVSATDSAMRGHY